MIPLPDGLIAWTAPPENGEVLVVSMTGELRLPGSALPGRRGDVLVAVPDDLGDGGVVADFPAPEVVADEAGKTPAAAEPAGVVGQSTGAGDGHDETVPEQMFDPFDGEPEPAFQGRELVDGIDSRGRV